MKLISIMTPCYNEEDNVLDVYESVKKVMTEKLSHYRYEHLFIDNCSTDKTPQILRTIASLDKSVKVIFNSRNFGAHRSPYHALLATSGDAVIPIMADLQDSPEHIPNMVKEWESGFKMVLGVRRTSEEGWLIYMGRKLYYRIIKRLSKIEMILNYTGFGLYDKRIIEVMRDLNDPNPYFRGLMSEIGFEKKFFLYDQKGRKKGKSKNGIFALFDYAMLALVTYSGVPFRAALYTGIFACFLGFVFAGTNSIQQLLSLKESIFLALLGIGIFLMGLVGETLGQMLVYSRNRPLVIESERINFDQLGSLQRKKDHGA